MSTAKRLCYFMSASSPTGFASYFGHLTATGSGYRPYLIKGAPGGGKSTMLQAVGDALVDAGHTVEFIHCSSDPDSLDAVVCREKGVAVMDATAPHLQDPKYPGAHEQVISLYGCIDARALQPVRDDIVAHLDATTACHARTCKFLSAAASLLADDRAIVSRYTDWPKLQRYAQSVARRHFAEKPGGRAGVRSCRMLSTIGQKGPRTFTDTVRALCPDIYLIEDANRAVAPAFLKILAESALAAGYDVTCCYWPLSPYDKLEHLLVPELGLAFVSQERQNTLSRELPRPYRHIYSRRFLDLDGLYAYRNRLSFNKKAAKELLAEAVKVEKEAAAHHDAAEALYRPAIDFEAVQKISDELVAAICG